MLEGVRWLVTLGALAACFSPSAPSGLPCGEGRTCPDGQTCDIISNECGVASVALVWRDDTAEDFGAGSGDVTIESQGFLGPAAFFTGGVRIAGYDGALITDLATASIDTIVADHTPTAAGLQHSLRIDFQATNPPGLGLANPDDATIVIDGEVELEAAGNWRFQLTANDRGLFEIAEPGSATFTRVIEDVNTGTTGTFAVTQPGWHKFRAAFQDQTLAFDFALVYDPPNIQGGAFRDIPSDRLRARVGDLDGLLVDGFDQANLIFQNGSLLSRQPLAAVPLEENPFALPIGLVAFSLRWSGQFLIDDPGDFSFALDTVHGHRLWIDGVLVADKFTSTAAMSTTAPLTLDAGWHDVVLDVTKEGGGPGSVSLIVASGPQFAGGALPGDHLRPVLGRGARAISDRNLAVLALPDGTGTSASRGLTIELPASRTSTLDVRAAVEVAGDNLASLSLVIDPPTGANIPVIAAGDFTGAGSELVHVPLAIANAGTNWLFIGTDALADTLIDRISSVFVTIVYDGGTPPFAPTSRYESAVRELGDVVGFERIAWTTRRDPAAITVRMRTCDTGETCTGPFVEVANNSEPALELRPFAQYEIEITSNGDVASALDAIELRYFVRE